MKIKARMDDIGTIVKLALYNKLQLLEATESLYKTRFLPMGECQIHSILNTRFDKQAAGERFRLPVIPVLQPHSATLYRSHAHFLILPSPCPAFFYICNSTNQKYFYHDLYTFCR